MKKFIGFILVMALAFTTNAQLAPLNSAAYPANLIDTVTNTGIKYLSTTTANRINGYQKVATVAVTVTKISGTVAGTLSLEGSLDGTNYYSLSATTYTATDVASQTFAWSLVDFGPVYVRVKYVGAGTMAASFGGKYVIRKPS